jgi:hypothetical integral membrane protein (TIGR02206 family)
VQDAPFVAYGPSHLAVIAVLAGGIVAFLAFGRWTSRWFDRTFAVAIVVIAVPIQLLHLTPAEWDLHTSLPLQLCDWAWLVAAIALWTRSHLAAMITYLWGLTLTTQAIFTPALATPFPELRWWTFWAMHLLIVWAAIHVIWGMKLLPTWQTYAQTVVITVMWLVVTFRLNMLLGTNYGYLLGKPARPSALDLLGPWPVYLFFEFLIVLAGWALLTWPWTRKPSAEPLVLG